MDRFDPNRLRLDLLRRLADAEAPAQPEEPGLLAKCADELSRWWSETPPVQLFRNLRRRSSPVANLAHAGDGTISQSTNASEGSNSASASSGAELAAPSIPSSAGADAGRNGVVEADGKDVTNGSSAKHRAAESAAHRKGFPARAICGHIVASLRRLAKDVKVMLFISFPSGSPFLDPTVEGLFQWHHSCQRWLSADWSSLALLTMLAWDVIANPPYRVTLVLLFYAAFGVLAILRKILFLAAPPELTSSARIFHNLLLFAFFFGRCVVCQPLFAHIGDTESRSFKALQPEAFVSVIGLGMTNLSMVFMQQMQTAEMFFFCLVNGVIFIMWILFVLQMPLTDALHTAYVGSIVITAVCVRQQRDLEEMIRRRFDHELLHVRGMLVRSADRVAQRASRQDFAICTQLLARSRRVETINF